MIEITFECGCKCAVFNLAFVKLTPKCTLHSINTREGKLARAELEKKAKEQAANYNQLKGI